MKNNHRANAKQRLKMKIMYVDESCD